MKLFKEKPIELHCYTNRADVYNYAPIKQSVQINRSWFKELNTNKQNKTLVGEHITAKSCPAIVNNLKTGIVLPLWSDVRVQVAPVGLVEDHWWKYQYADGISRAENHTFNQLGMCEYDKEAMILKLVSPSRFKCSHDISFFYAGDQLELLKYDNLEIIQGVIDFKYQASASVNVLIRKKENETDIVLSFLMSLLKLIPLTEKKIKVINHLVSDSVWENLNQINTKTSFNSSYYKNKGVMCQKNSHFKHETDD